MQKYIQHEYLKISNFVVDQWHHPIHDHNHFEIIYIHQGKGVHQISGIDYTYEAKSLFLLGPSDYHHFLINEKTEFTFLKFTNVYLNGVGNIQVNNDWNRKIDELLNITRNATGPFLKDEKAVIKVDGIMNLIVQEWKETKSEHSEIIYFLIQALLATLKLNSFSSNKLKPTRQDAKIVDILNYIHQRIYNPGEIQLEKLSEQFGLSRFYFGSYFKEQTGVSYRDYLNQYKLHLIQNRLKYSSFSIKEISNELGFTDLSHFNKFYKKLTGISPSHARVK